ncbi:DNA-directed RNA polymerase subunit L [Candidatus Woesearchaeota archaeon]|nr:DNA-directed RNA polymerase subunit L [Candidatus Woesearchaeota archaeon]
MEIEVIEDKKSKFVFEIKGVQEGILNALKNELHNDDHVKIATYSKKHPIVGNPKMILETDGADPREVLAKAAGRLKKANDKIRADVKKEIK